MKKILPFFLLILLMTVSGSAQQVERQVNLDPGWNTVGFDVAGVRFSEDIQPKCTFGWYNQRLEEGADESDIDQGSRYKVWAQTGGDWSHPDYLNPSKGYSLFLDQDSSCSFTVQGEKVNTETLNIEQEWNIVNIESNSDIGAIWDQCGGNDGLAWWSTLIDQGLDDEDIWDSDRYHFWVNRGNDWRHPFKNSYNVQLTDGVYVNGREDCTVDLDVEEEDSPDEEPLVEDYLILEDASTSVTEVSRNQDLEVSLDISLNNDPEDIGARPTIALLRNGQRIEERTINWDSDSVVFEWDRLWTGDEESDVEFDIIMERNNEGEYRWERQSDSLGSLDIGRCGEDYVFNRFHEENGAGYDGCIPIEQGLLDARSDIEDSTGWRLRTTNSVIHTLESIEGEETADGDRLLIDTGEEGFCGRAYFENEYSGSDGSFTVDVDMKTLGDPDRLGFNQDPQTFFIQIDGENATVQDLDHGESKEFTHEVDQGDVVRMGILGDPDPPLFGCGQWSSRTAVEMDVEGDFDSYDGSGSSGGLPGTVR